MSLSSRVTAVLLTVLAVAIALTGFLAYRKFEAGLAELAAARYRIVIDDLRAPIVTSLDLGVPIDDLTWVQSLIDERLADDPDIGFIELLNAEGHVVVSSDVSGVGQLAPASWNPAHGAAPGAEWQRREAGFVIIGQPVLSGFGTVQATLVLGYAQSALDGRLAAMRDQLALIGSITLAVFAVILALLTSVSMRGPKRELAAMARAIEGLGQGGPAAPVLGAAGLQAQAALETLEGIREEIERLDEEGA